MKMIPLHAAIKAKRDGFENFVLPSVPSAEWKICEQ